MSVKTSGRFKGHPDLPTLLSKLTPRERRVIELRYSGSTLEATGKEFDVSRERARGIQVKAESKMDWFERFPNRGVKDWQKRDQNPELVK